MASRKKVRTRSGPRARRRKPDFRADICGQTYDFVIDPKLTLEGECDFDSNTIRLSPKAFWRMVDTFLHEALHAMIDGSGMGWAMRRRLKMSKAQWHNFEEDFIVRPMTPALLSFLKNARMLRVPSFLKRGRKAA